MEQGIDIIGRYFPGLSVNQKERLTKLQPLYESWNTRINLISRKDTGHLYERHVLHSLGIAKIITFSAGNRVLDLGTGGGFPGIPLAILFPETSFHLVDSIGKKIRAVEAITAELGLANVTAEKIRAEELTGQYDFIVTRAVADLSRLITWTTGRIRPGASGKHSTGLLALKGGDLSQELRQLKRDYAIYNLCEHFTGTFFETKRVVYISF